MRALPLVAAFGIPLLVSTPTVSRPLAPDCQVVGTIVVRAKVRNGRVIEDRKRAYRFADGSVMFMGRLTIDADGSPRAYHPVSAQGQDALGNAGSPGNWWAIATHNCRANGRPVVQRSGDPAPGFYISKTSMTDASAAGGCANQRRYVNSDTIPYAAIPAAIAKIEQNRGRLVVALSPHHETPTFAVHADQPPAYGIGEGSMEFARRLGYRPNPRNGGTGNREIVWLVLTPRMGFPANADSVDSNTRTAFDTWGGMPRLRACAAVIRGMPL